MCQHEREARDDGRSKIRSTEEKSCKWCPLKLLYLLLTESSFLHSLFVLFYRLLPPFSSCHCSSDHGTKTTWHKKSVATGDSMKFSRRAKIDSQSRPMRMRILPLMVMMIMKGILKDQQRKSSSNTSFSLLSPFIHSTLASRDIILIHSLILHNSSWSHAMSHHIFYPVGFFLPPPSHIRYLTRDLTAALVKWSNQEFLLQINNFYSSNAISWFRVSQGRRNLARNPENSVWRLPVMRAMHSVLLG